MIWIEVELSYSSYIICIFKSDCLEICTAMKPKSDLNLTVAFNLYFVHLPVPPPKKSLWFTLFTNTEHKDFAVFKLFVNVSVESEDLALLFVSLLIFNKKKIIELWVKVIAKTY